MPHIRAFSPEHIPGVTALHRAAFRPTVQPTPADCEAYERYLTGVFLSSPVSDPSLPSLVCEDDGGRVVGFIGVASRTVLASGRRLRAAVSTQFVVEPGGAAGLFAVRLAKAFLDGPQDFSIADNANDMGRGIWEKLGGKTDRLLSLHWTRPLRPARLALSFLRNRRGLAPLAALGAPLAALADEVVTRMPSSHFRQTQPESVSVDVDTAEMLAQEPELCRTVTLRVEHEEPSFSWLLRRAAKSESGGQIRKTVIEQGQKVLGWCIWQFDRGGTAEVLQLTATESSIDSVLDHVFYETWKAGALAVSGRLDPQFIQALSDKYCLFHRRGPWTLVHSKRPELLQPFWIGSASFARIDGEWPLAFGA